MDKRTIIQKDVEGRLDAFRDIQEGLWLEGCQIELTGLTTLEVFDIATGEVGVIPLFLANLIDKWEADIIESLREDTPAEVYAGEKGLAAVARRFKAKRPPRAAQAVSAGGGTKHPDPFDEPVEGASTTFF